MSISSQFIQRVENAVYHAPYMIPSLFKDCKVKAGFVHSRLRRYVPHRVGIEFECFGDFANQYLKNTKRSWTKWEDFEKNFKILDFSQDTPIYHKDSGVFDGTEEIRVSIQDYRQLSGLYHILQEMAKYCTISNDCGIHIHIDLTKYDKSSQIEKAINWFNKHMDEVESIFPKYTGKYNRRGAACKKGYWINLSNKDTVEFRIAPLTFDYEVLIVWIVKCSKLVSRMISECHLDKSISDAVTKVSDYTSINNTIILNQDLISGSTHSPNLIDEALRLQLENNNIRYVIDGSNLILSWDNGQSSIISYLTALQLLRDEGIDAVIREAHPYFGDTLPSTSETLTNAGLSIINGNLYYQVSDRSCRSNWYSYSY